MKLILRLLLILPFLTVSTNATSVDLYEVEGFEIYGMKLGDAGEQIVDKLSEHFSIAREDLTIDDFGSGIEFVEYRAEEIWVRAFIEGDFDPVTSLEIPESPRKLTLLWIEWQNQDYIAFGNELKDTLGPPTLPTSVPADLPPEVLWEHGYYWCSQLNAAREGCEDGSNALWVHSYSVKNSEGRAILVDKYE